MKPQVIYIYIYILHINENAALNHASGTCDLFHILNRLIMSLALTHAFHNFLQTNETCVRRLNLFIRFDFHRQPTVYTGSLFICRFGCTPICLLVTTTHWQITLTQVRLSELFIFYLNEMSGSRSLFDMSYFNALNSIRKYRSNWLTTILSITLLTY